MTTLAMEYPETMTSMTTATPALAGRGARLGAALLDLLIFSVFLIPGIWIMSSSDSDMGKGFGGAFLVFGWLGLLVTQMVFLVMRGQSLGKMAVGIKIVRVADGSVPGFVKVVLLRMFVPSLLAAIPYAGALIWLADVLFIFRDDRRCLHDLIAETKVVDAQAKTPEATVSSQHQTTDLRLRTNMEQLIVAQPPSVKEASTFSATAGTVDSALDNPLDTTVDEDRIYVVIANELETGATDKGSWTRLFAECNGDLQQVKILYIKQRAERLIEAEKARIELEARERATAAEKKEKLRLAGLSLREKLASQNISKELAAQIADLSRTHDAVALLNRVRMNQQDDVLPLLNQNPLLVAVSNSEGDTALHIALREKNARMVRLLIEKGAQAEIPNAYGVTPLELASKSGQPELVSLLAIVA